MSLCDVRTARFKNVEFVHELLHIWELFLHHDPIKVDSLSWSECELIVVGSLLGLSRKRSRGSALFAEFVAAEQFWWAELESRSVYRFRGRVFHGG